MKPSVLQQRGFSINELRRLARRILPRMVFDFVDGGAEDELTRDRNMSAFERIELLPRMLRATPRREQSIELFGQRLSSPVIIAPTGMSGMLWPRGELEVARAAAAAGTVMTISHGSTRSLEEIAAVGAGPKWFQVFIYKDRGVTRDFVERAQAAGYQALCLTVDCQTHGQRERDLRNGFTVPPRITLGNSLDMLLRLRWLLRMARSPRISFKNYEAHGSGGLVELSSYMASLVDAEVDWDDFSWLRSLWSGPLLLKGLLHPGDARRALELGADGIIVSNHGGRQLDGAPAALDALPGIVEAVEGRVPVLLDGGIRRGASVLKAIALGADACMIGRPHLWGLAVAGQDGVAWVLELLRREIDRAMALGGWDSLSEIDHTAIRLNRSLFDAQSA